VWISSVRHWWACSCGGKVKLWLGRVLDEVACLNSKYAGTSPGLIAVWVCVWIGCFVMSV